MALQKRQIITLFDLKLVLRERFRIGSRAEQSCEKNGRKKLVLDISTVNVTPNYPNLQQVKQRPGQLTKK